MIDEHVQKVDVARLVRRYARRGSRAVVALCGVQTNQFPRAADLAREFRAKGLPVMIGGFHVSGAIAMSPNGMPPECRALIDDGVTLVKGEVEECWGDLLRDALHDRLAAFYDVRELPDLSRAPIPTVDPALMKRYAYPYMGTIDAGRGCPFNCSFCTITRYDYEWGLIMNTKHLTCPQCGQRVESQQRYSPNCHVDLALAAVWAEEQLSSLNQVPAGIPVTPEILVPRLGEYLVEKGYITEHQLGEALNYQGDRIDKGHRIVIGQALIELNMVSPEILNEVVTIQILELQGALRRANRELEMRVQERTRDLERAVEKLKELSQLKAKGSTAGISSFDGEKWVSYESGEELGFVSEIFQDGHGRLWFAGDVVMAYDGTNWQTYTMEDGLGSNTAASFAEDREGNLWLGTWYEWCGCEGSPGYTEGVSRFDGQSWDVLGKEIGLDDNEPSSGIQVKAMAVDKQGGIWFGTSGFGARYYRDGKTKSFTDADNLPDNTIHDIQIDAKGAVWLATSHGVAQYKGSKWSTFQTKDGLAGVRLQARRGGFELRAAQADRGLRRG